MADDPQTTTPAPTMKGAIMTLSPKVVLAFFLVCVAAALVVFFIVILLNRPTGSPPLEAGTVALLAGFITTFLLMAKSASDYQFVSSSGSDKKDDANTAVSKALADKVPPPVAPAPTLAPAPIAWWGRLKNGEPASITAAAAADSRVMAFITAANIGAATPDDLAYLVSKNLLTQDRATAIQSA